VRRTIPHLAASAASVVASCLCVATREMELRSRPAMGKAKVDRLRARCGYVLAKFQPRRWEPQGRRRRDVVRGRPLLVMRELFVRGLRGRLEKRARRGRVWEMLRMVMLPLREKRDLSLILQARRRWGSSGRGSQERVSIPCGSRSTSLISRGRTRHVCGRAGLMGGADGGLGRDCGWRCSGRP
jgi:hypothetical protein